MSLSWASVALVARYCQAQRDTEWSSTLLGLSCALPGAGVGRGPSA